MTYDYFADPNCCRLVMKFALIQLLLNWFPADHYERVKLKFRAVAQNIKIRDIRMPHMEIPFESRERMEQTYASLVPIVQCELNNRTDHPRILLPVQQMIKNLRQIPDIARLCSTL